MISENICSLAKITDRPSRIIFRKYTGATRSAKKTAAAHGYGTLVNHAHENTPRWRLRMHYKHLKMQQWKTRRQCQTSQASTWNSPRALTKHKRKFLCSPSSCRHFSPKWTSRNQQLRNLQLTIKGISKIQRATSRLTEGPAIRTIPYQHTNGKMKYTKCRKYCRRGW